MNCTWILFKWLLIEYNNLKKIKNNKFKLLFTEN